MSPESSLDLLLPLTACRLLGGATSSTALDAGLFLSSILAKVAGRGGADGVVATGIRKGAAGSRASPAVQKGSAEGKKKKVEKKRRIKIRNRVAERWRNGGLESWASATPPRENEGERDGRWWKGACDGKWKGRRGRTGLRVASRPRKARFPLLQLCAKLLWALAPPSIACTHFSTRFFSARRAHSRTGLEGPAEWSGCNCCVPTSYCGR